MKPLVAVSPSVNMNEDEIMLKRAYFSAVFNAGGIPMATDLSGAKWLAVRIKGDGDMRKIGIGLELKDGRLFTTYMQMDLHDNWKDWFFPLSLFKNEQGILDTTQIKSVLFTSLDDGPGSFIIDNIGQICENLRIKREIY